MKRLSYDPSWPASWKASFNYDRQEIYGEILNPGYFYAYQVRAQQTIQLVRELLPSGAKILDIAGAHGNFSLQLAELGYEVTWNEIRGGLQP